MDDLTNGQATWLIFWAISCGSALIYSLAAMVYRKKTGEMALCAAWGHKYKHKTLEYVRYENYCTRCGVKHT